MWIMILIIFISTLIIFPFRLTTSPSANFPTTISRAVGSRSIRYLVPFRNIRNETVLFVSGYLLGDRYSPDDREIIRENSESLVGTVFSILLFIRLLDIWEVGPLLLSKIQTILSADVVIQIFSNFAIDYGSIVSALGAIFLARGSLLGSISNFRQTTDLGDQALKGTIYEFWGFVMLFLGYSFIIVESVHILLGIYIPDFWIWSGAAVVFSIIFSIELVLHLTIWILSGIVFFFSSFVFLIFSVALFGDSIFLPVISVFLLIFIVFNVGF